MARKPSKTAEPLTKSVETKKPIVSEKSKPRPKSIRIPAKKAVKTGRSFTSAHEDAKNFARLKRRELVFDLRNNRATYREIALILKDKLWLFEIDDFVQPYQLASLLNAQKDNLTKYLYSFLSVKSQDFLTYIAKTKKLNKEHLVCLKDEFNRIIQTQFIYEKTRFAKIPLSPETKTLLKLGANNAEFNKLNRLLLEDAFPAEIRKSAHDAEACSLATIHADYQYMLDLQYTEQILKVEQYLEEEINNLNEVHKYLHPFMVRARTVRDLREAADGIVNVVVQRAKLRNIYKPREIVIRDKSDFAKALGIEPEELPDVGETES